MNKKQVINVDVRRSIGVNSPRSQRSMDSDRKGVIYGPPRIARQNLLFDKKNNAPIYPALK